MIEKLTGSWYEVEGQEVLRFFEMNWQRAKIERTIRRNNGVTLQIGIFEWVGVAAIRLELPSERGVMEEYWVWPSENGITLRRGDYETVLEYKRRLPS